MPLLTKNQHYHHRSRCSGLAASLSVSLLLCSTGCRTKPSTVDDATLATGVQSQLAADTVLGGQPIQVTVVGAVVTLSGSVQNDTQRALAARDAASVAGVREVIDGITLTAPQTAASTGSRPRIAVPSKGQTQPEPTRFRQPAPVERPQQAYNQPPPVYNPLPAQPAPPPLAPAFRTLTIPSGETLPVRITQTLDSATTQQGSTFSGVIASDVMVDGLVALPAGASVSGNVDAVQEASHYKGSSSLTVSLSSVSRHGDRLSVSTDPYSVKGKGRGANTAEKVGGGAAVGAILGGIFGGGKGAAIGAAAGGGAGAGVNTVTRGQQVQITSESVVRFTLQAPITLKVRTDGSESRGDGAPRLRPQSPQ